VKTIILPADTERLYLDDVAHLIADCINPQGPNDPEGTRYKAALEALAPELEQAANSGALRTRHPETLGTLPPVVPSSDPLDRLLDCTFSIPLRYRVVTVPDFTAYVADRGMAVAMEAPEQTTQPQAAPAQSPATPAPVAQTTKRRTWWDVSSPYIVETMRAGQYATAKELYKALEAKAGSGSPFEKGTGNNRSSLFIRELAAPLSLKTMQNKWPEMLKAAAHK
jgi:hypothetical protein